MMSKYFEKIKCFLKDKNIYLRFRMQMKPVLITLASAFLTSFLLLSYVAKDLGGNFEWLIMPAKMFGIPEELKAKTNLRLVYEDDINCGWDGQFYYYISNDLLGLKDTPKHIDAPSYRYQRIALPLWAKIISLIFFKPLVSVKMYTFAYLLLLMLAAYFFACFLKKHNHSVLWILPWFFSVGVQITLRHALIDGAADAFILLSLLLLLERKYFIYSAIMTMACLSKESNVSIAFLVFVFGFLGILEKEKKWNIKFATVLAIPGIIFIIWYSYISIHFGSLPYKIASDANITAPFMTGFVKYLAIALKSGNWLEAFGNILYALIVLLAFFLEIVNGKKNHVFWTLLLFTFLMASYGSTVMMHYSGYLKNISSLLIFIPIMLVYNDNSEPKHFWETKPFKNSIAIFMTIIFISGFIYSENHARGVYFYTLNPPVKENPTVSSLSDFSSTIKVNDISFGKKDIVTMPLSSFFMKKNKYLLINVTISNLSAETWHSGANKVGMFKVCPSYHYFLESDMKTVVIDGFRTSLKNDLLGHSSKDMDMIVKLPNKAGNYILRLTFVQEGVAWFYNVGGGYCDLKVNIDSEGNVAILSY